jgi:hypothetical protein
MVQNKTFIICSLLIFIPMLICESVTMTSLGESFTIAINLNTMMHFELLTAILGIISSPDKPMSVDASIEWKWFGIKNVIIPQHNLRINRQRLLVESPSYSGVNISFTNDLPNRPVPGADLTIIITTFAKGGGTKDHQLEHWSAYRGDPSILFLVHNIPVPLSHATAYRGLNAWYISPHASRLGLPYIVPSYTPLLPLSFTNSTLPTLPLLRELKPLEGRIVGLVIGNVVKEHRDYRALFKGLEALRLSHPEVMDQLCIAVVGRTNQASRDLLRELDSAVSSGLVVLYDNVPNNDLVYLYLLRRAHFIIPLIHRAIPTHQVYFRTKLAASINQAIGLGVPVVAHRPLFLAYSKMRGVPYDNSGNHFVNALVDIVKCINDYDMNIGLVLLSHCLSGSG